MQHLMKNVMAKSAATTEQLYDSHSGVQQQLTKMATQVADTNADFRENRKCTLAARMEELVQHSPPSTRNTSSTRRAGALRRAHLSLVAATCVSLRLANSFLFCFNSVVGVLTWACTVKLSEPVEEWWSVGNALSRYACTTLVPCKLS
jgi:hypothetical protein